MYSEMYKKVYEAIRLQTPFSLYANFVGILTADYTSSIMMTMTVNKESSFKRKIS